MAFAVENGNMFKKVAEGDIFSTKQEIFYCAGSRTAILPDGKLICVFNAESKTGVNDWIPMAAYSDDGITWSEAKPVWPQLIGKKSVYVNVRPTMDGRVSLCGIGFEIDAPGEVWWSDELAAMKENKIVWSVSADGYDFPEPAWTELPYYGSAENPGGMLIDADGTMHVVYAPYPTIEHRAETDTCCVVYMRSTDGGKTFVSKKIGQVAPPSEYAETWIVRLSDGKLMVGTWQTASTDAPDQYLLSDDDGETFSGPFALPFRGQSMALTPWKDGVLIVYNQRKEKPAGVWMAAAKPDADGLHMFANQPVWEASTTTRSASSGDFGQWTDFSFGEPQVTVLPDGKLLVCLWYEQDGKKGVRYVLAEQL